MTQSNPIAAIAAGFGKAAVTMVQCCSPRGRAVRQRLREIADCEVSAGAIGAAWAIDRRAEPACLPWALAA